MSETSCGTWAYERSTRSLAPRFRVIHQSGFPAWLSSEPSQPRIRSGQRISLATHCARASCTWRLLSICSHGMCTAGGFPTALTRNSLWRPWKWRWPVAANRRSSTPIRDASSPAQPSFNDSRLRRSRLAGQDVSAALTTFWWRGCCAPLSMRKCICVPTAMAGEQRSAWLASSGGMAM